MLDMDTGRKDVYVRPTENWGLYYVIFCVYIYMYMYIYVYIYIYRYRYRYRYRIDTEGRVYIFMRACNCMPLGVYAQHHAYVLVLTFPEFVTLSHNICM